MDDQHAIARDAIHSHSGGSFQGGADQSHTQQSLQHHIPQHAANTLHESAVPRCQRVINCDQIIVCRLGKARFYPKLRPSYTTSYERAG